jgi:hypothetical protein
MGSTTRQATARLRIERGRLLKARDDAANMKWARDCFERRARIPPAAPTPDRGADTSKGLRPETWAGGDAALMTPTTYSATGGCRPKRGPPTAHSAPDVCSGSVHCAHVTGRVPPRWRCPHHVEGSVALHLRRISFIPSPGSNNVGTSMLGSWSRCPVRE